MALNRNLRTRWCRGTTERGRLADAALPCQFLAVVVAIIEGHRLALDTQSGVNSTPPMLGHPDGDTADTSTAAAPLVPTHPPFPTGFAIWRDRRFATLSTAFALGLFDAVHEVEELDAPA